MTRIVIDSNVYISALVFGGVPQKVLDLIQGQSLGLYISKSIMDEVAGVLFRKFDWASEEIDRFLPTLWERCIIVRPTITLRISEDPDDNRVLECAEAAEADFLVTGNTRHFPKFHKATKIVNPRQLLALLAERQQ